MKKLLLTISTLIASAISVTAQAPDLGFETWVNVPLSSSVQDPQGWASFNVLTSFGMTQTVFKETTTPYAGSASAKIVTDVLPSNIQVPNPFTPGQNFDTVGLLTIGKTQFTAPYMKFGYSYTLLPTSLSFASKYTPVTGDSAFVIAFLTKWNGASRDTIARGMYSTGANSGTYSTQNLMMVYNPAFTGIVPDSQLVFVSSSILSHNGAKKGSTFYIDALAWSGFVSTNDIDEISNMVSVYPNPAQSQITFNCSVNVNAIEIMDITGRIVNKLSVTSDKSIINTSAYTNGIYSYAVIGNNNRVVNRGKFTITK
jgi:hypothetical protein